MWTINPDEPAATNKSQESAGRVAGYVYGKLSEGLWEVNMWQPEVTGVLPAQGLDGKGLFLVASRIHIKRTALEPDAASSHQCAVRYINKPTHSYLSKKICKHVFVVIEIFSDKT